MANNRNAEGLWWFEEEWPNRLMDLNTWALGSGTTGERLGSVALLEQVQPP